MDGRFLEPLAADNPADPVLRVMQIAAPGANTEITRTVPGESTWLFVALTTLFHPDANAASRVPVLQFTDGTNVIAQVPTGTTIPTGADVTVSWVADGVTTSTTANGATLAVNTPKLILPPGFQIKTATTARQVGDTYTQIVLTAVEVLAGKVAQEAHIMERILDRLEALHPNALAPY